MHYVCIHACMYVCIHALCIYVCMYKRKFSITYNDSVLKRSHPVPVQVWLLPLCWRKREALVNQMEKSHIFMTYLFIRFQNNGFLMSTKYLQYLLKILSVTLSAQISPVAPTIPDVSHCCRSCFEPKLVTRLLFLQAIPEERGGHKQNWSLLS